MADPACRLILLIAYGIGWFALGYWLGRSRGGPVT